MSKKDKTDYEPLRINVEKFKGKREPLWELFKAIQTTIMKVPGDPYFIFKCDLTEEGVKNGE